MTDIDRGQVSASAAEIYESFFVPALFAQWTDAVLEAAAVAPGKRVLDVGCGSGVLTRAAARRVGASGAVSGVDPNDGMLAVARHSVSSVEWRRAVAEDLPFADSSFDCVVSQFAYMFFSDPAGAIHEMGRVTRPGGHVALAVWAPIEHSPGYAALAALVERLFGTDAADAIRAPFADGDATRLGKALAAVSPDPVVARLDGVAQFESLESWLHTEIRGWTLADVIDDDGFASLLHHARSELQRFVEDRKVAFPISAHVASAKVGPAPGR